VLGTDGAAIGLYTILPSPILYDVDVWHTKDKGSVGGGAYIAQWACNSIALW